MTRTALVTGISGQDGAYLARALLARGYRVVGAFRRTSGISIGRLEDIRNSTGLPRSTRCGDARKAKTDLGWEAKTSLEGLIQMMVKADYDRVKTGIIRC